MWVRWDDSCFGAPAVDSKRPYGNSSVVDDIFEILEWESKYEDINEHPAYYEACALHKDMETVLQILIDCRSIQEGSYVNPTKWSNKGWKLKETT